MNGGRAYLASAPGWPAASKLNPDNPGVFVPAWDQGVINVGNGNSDGSWVHDDIRVTAVAMERDGKRLILITNNTYMILKADVDEISQRIHAALPTKWADAEVLISSSHNHHGPETAFGPNPKWFEMAAGQFVKAAVAAAAAVEPATASVANGVHNYGTFDQRDPLIYDNRLNVLAFDSSATGRSIATMVQWNSHPETTLGWTPPAPAGLTEACATKGWTGSKCTTKDRYFTGDFVGVLETRLKASRGGEVAYFNGALGVLASPLHASTWVVDKDHPVGNGTTVPAGAVPLATCTKTNQYECQSFAKTESVGNELANAVTALLATRRVTPFQTITVRKQEFYSRLTNLGFRALIATGGLGWKPMPSYNCTGKPFTDANCVAAAATETVSDPVLTPAMGLRLSKGDVLKSRVAHVSFGDVGMLFVPGELPGELVVGLPSDFTTASSKYFTAPAEHVAADKFAIPGNYLSLVKEPVTFFVGLGTDELGYFVPASDYRLQCHAISLSAVPGASCADLAARGVIESPTWIGGLKCQKVFDDPAFFAALGADGPAVKAICYYGQVVGSQIAKPAGHYEETNAAGWDLVDDLWAATVKMFATK
ncbi:hypothetical protein UC35_06710 [Ramlibacter tataouinensis]|uniref:Neutral/alkaline non-lysosomal ceramidase N-terminal domain-containing protein n=1 Tax=Ramlibacter tataouinensis TaxID=94132 RepID=A0A127JRN2_9BURK|nr:hypothetical protein UC35_06710 [Ramlibacter tataouinensis]